MSLLYYPQNYLHLYQHSLLSLFLLILHLVLALGFYYLSNLFQKNYCLLLTLDLL